MVDNETIARPYARAAFEFAFENNSVTKWSDFLEAFVYAVENSNIVNSANVLPYNKVVEILSNILKDFYDNNCLNFLKILVENQRLTFSKEIRSEFLSLVENSKNLKRALVCSASELSADDLSRIKTKLKSKYHCEIVLDTKVDASLIGGLIVKVGDEVIDASVRTRLDKLSNVLQS